MKQSKKEFYFRHQGGRCYLQITDLCRKRDGQMTINLKGHNPIATDATWEHVTPRAKGGGNSTQLLACSACNHQKGDVQIATEAQLIYARLLSRVWRRVSGGQKEEKAFRAECAPWIERDGVRVFAMTLPVDPTMPVDMKASRRKMLLKTRPPYPSQMNVPETVEEALAQGGIKVSR